MSTHTDNLEADALEASPPPRTVGQELAAERERQGLSRAEIAQRLHMSQWQVEALEAGDYARLPKGTFLRGFVRNYAKVLGKDGGELLTRLAESAPHGPAPGIVVPSQNIRFDPIGERLSNPYVKAGALAVVAIALAFAVMYWWLFIRPAPPAGMSKREVPAAPHNLAAAPVPAPEPVVPTQAPTEMPKAEVKPEPAKVEPSASSAAPAKPAPGVVNPGAGAQPTAPVKAPAQPAVTTVAQKAAADRRLKLRFKGESWVEIKDRSGRVLLSRLNPPGSEAEVSGRPPFAVVIGNAPLVEMLYEDREFPLEPHTRVAVARFTVE